MSMNKWQKIFKIHQISRTTGRNNCVIFDSTNCQLHNNNNNNDNDNDNDNENENYNNNYNNMDNNDIIKKSRIP